MAATLTVTQFPQNGQDQAPTGLTIYQRLNLVQNDLPVMQKTGFNKEQNYHFIEGSAIAGIMQGLFAKHGVFLKSELGQVDFTDFTSKSGAKGERVKVLFDFTFINCFDGADVIKYQPWPGVAMDYSDKALNKAMTAAQKTFLMKQFLISDVDPDAFDPQAEAPQPAPARPTTPPQPAQQQNRPPSAAQQQPPAQKPPAAPAPKPPVQPSQALGETLAISKLPDITRAQFDGWLKEMNTLETNLAQSLSGGDNKTLKTWAEAYKAKNPDARIKNWFRFALHEYVTGLMKHKPEAGWLWDDETQLPRQLEDVPFEEEPEPEDLPE